MDLGVSPHPPSLTPYLAFWGHSIEWLYFFILIFLKTNNNQKHRERVYLNLVCRKAKSSNKELAKTKEMVQDKKEYKKRVEKK